MKPRDLEETLYVMELANLQLAELEAYDRWLDGALERSYRDLGRRSSQGPGASGARFERDSHRPGSG